MKQLEEYLFLESRYKNWTLFNYLMHIFGFDSLVHIIQYFSTDSLLKAVHLFILKQHKYQRHWLKV